MVVRLDNLLRGKEDQHEERDDDDGDGAELPLEECDCALLDRGCDLAHRLGALVGGKHAAHQIQRYQDCYDSSGKGEAQPGARSAPPSVNAWYPPELARRWGCTN